jgi:hypothetical protein
VNDAQAVTKPHAVVLAQSNAQCQQEAAQLNAQLSSAPPMNVASKCRRPSPHTMHDAHNQSSQRAAQIKGATNVIFHARRVASITLLFAATFIFTPMAAQAEVITLQCLFSGAPMATGLIVIIDLSARTGVLKGIAENSGITFNLTDVAISDSAFSFARDILGVSRVTSTIDRTNGSFVSEVYNYPGSGMSGTSRGTGQCTKIPNKAF